MPSITRWSKRRMEQQEGVIEKKMVKTLSPFAGWGGGGGRSLAGQVEDSDGISEFKKKRKVLGPRPVLKTDNG